MYKSVKKNFVKKCTKVYNFSCKKKNVQKCTIFFRNNIHFVQNVQNVQNVQCSHPVN